jgi:deazaflavin-dependent oxidoreductase (nitroreductase family)
MNSQPERLAHDTAGPLEPVGPSPFARIVMRPMTKMLNPLIVKLAGRRHFRMAAQIRHVGRRSGRTYTTPVTARRNGDMVVIALTFGNQSDWSRNVRFAGGGSIRIEGEDYDVTQPQIMSRQDARPLVQAAFSPMERAGFRMLAIKQVMTLRLASATHLPGAAATVAHVACSRRYSDDRAIRQQQRLQRHQQSRAAD